VIYELLVGTKLFVSEFQLCRYFSGAWPFPEERLRVLSPPANNTGISLLRAMLAIQPGDRPTATRALGYRWLTDLRCGYAGGGDDKGEATESSDWSTLSRKREGRPATHSEQNKTPKRNMMTPEGTKYIPGDTDLQGNTGSKVHGNLPIPECSFDTSIVTLSDTATTEGLPVPTGPWKSRFVSRNILGTHHKSPKRVRTTTRRGRT